MISLCLFLCNTHFLGKDTLLERNRSKHTLFHKHPIDGVIITFLDTCLIGDN